MRLLRKIKYIIAAGAAGGVLASYLTVSAAEVVHEEKYREDPSLFSQNNSRSKWDFNWDKQEPHNLVKPSKSGTVDSEKVEKVKPTATRNLILIRHGQYNLKGTCDVERYLTSLGIEQADYTGKRLKELAMPYSSIVQSSMCRARETANVISGHLPNVPLHTCDLLQEGAPFPPEPPVGHWKPEMHQFYRDGARIEAAFRKYFHRAEASQKEDSYEILVCHANVIRFFVCRALQFPPEAWLRMSLHNASVTWIAIRPSGRVVLRALGDCGHLPPAKLTTT
ncbi:serine/threonine-protein phosphatase PGAM5, mitochondrial-like isoform X1 [Daphnia pulex]|uniref:serine/threonine-protein phosphatase PGAM5, mitochondrial-like isoform X1 n=1 Tax=Daphnia pulex TaxID=6669 RepID=UPI001EDD1332|nr:serine/threonine-protein phosphatase PGAM5, mitochondrial-like isoform X1 [Daphnia pulex]